MEAAFEKLSGPVVGLAALGGAIFGFHLGWNEVCGPDAALWAKILVAIACAIGGGLAGLVAGALLVVLLVLVIWAAGVTLAMGLGLAIVVGATALVILVLRAADVF